MKNIAIFGAGGSIGSALVNLYAQSDTNHVTALSREKIEFSLPNVSGYKCDPTIEESLKAFVNSSKQRSYDLIISTVGTLHGDGYLPEKNVDQIDPESVMHIMNVNLISSMLIGKYCQSLINTNQQSTIAFLTARVGSISDNNLGGWYAYRCSKASVNMFIKTFQIEMQRKKNGVKVIGLHPGTVKSELSLPFIKGVPKERLFSPKQSAQYLKNVIDSTKEDHGGKVFAWDGSEILP
jgi:NAD(P)-dependent dehydrogenase (short-subunit alcohol dehydrogenase family)